MTSGPSRHVVIFCAIALAIAVLFWWRREPNASIAASNREHSSRTALPAVSRNAGAASKAAAPAQRDGTPPEGESRVADDLNTPGGTIQRDLQILNEVFEMWLTNFPREGNPVGENPEITAALTGDNVHRFAFIPQRHRAINDRGELCDRWGTPFRFHQLSGRQMEIRSAGPDRKFGTADDASWTPQP
jgi:hypothetical protein